MKIIRELALWMLKSEHLDVAGYEHVKKAILKESLSDAEAKAVREMSRHERRKELERESSEDNADAFSYETALCHDEAWWRLPGKSKGGGRRGRRPGTRKLTAEELDAKLPALLPMTGGQFPLAELILSVGRSSCLTQGATWADFSETVASLYVADADVLHDRLRVTMLKSPDAIRDSLLALEEGATLFPKDLLSGYSGEAVSTFVRKIDGDSAEFRSLKTDWILRYPNICTVNEACLVRNRLHRIFRLWLAEGSTRHLDCRLTPGHVCLHLHFDERIVHIPLAETVEERSPSDSETIEIPPDMDEIGEGVFADYTKIRSLEIPDHVRRVGRRAFAGCESLEIVTVGCGVEVVEDEAFQECRKIRSVVFRGGADEAATLEIGSHAFLGSACETVRIDRRNVVIRPFAFQLCWYDYDNGTVVEGISDGRCQLDDNAFRQSHAIVRNALIGRAVKMGQGVFADCSSLREALFSPELTRIEMYSFYRCAALERVQFGPKLTFIGNDAFNGCGSLARLRVPDAVVRIAARAFKDCKALEDVQMGAGLKILSDEAFAGCTALRSVWLPDGIRTIGSRVFENVDVSLPDGVPDVANDAFVNCRVSFRPKVD